jgi:hypothetical protein
MQQIAAKIVYHIPFMTSGIGQSACVSRAKGTAWLRLMQFQNMKSDRFVLTIIIVYSNPFLARLNLSASK